MTDNGFQPPSDGELDQRYTSPGEATQGIGFIGDLFQSDQDKLLAALVNNQRVMISQLQRIANQTSLGDSPSGTGDIQELLQTNNDLLRDQIGGVVDVTSLPIGQVGRMTAPVSSGARGNAIFSFSGSDLLAEVKVTEDVETRDYVVISGPDNQADPVAGNVSDTVDTGSGDGSLTFEYQGEVYRVPRVIKDENDVKVSNQLYQEGSREPVNGSLGAGSNKTFARVQVASDEVFLLKYTNATSVNTAEYDYYIDSEDPDTDLSGQSPWATPPDLYEVAPGGFRLVEDSVEIQLTETSGTNSYSNVQATPGLYSVVSRPVCSEIATATGSSNTAPTSVTDQWLVGRRAGYGRVGLTYSGLPTTDSVATRGPEATRESFKSDRREAVGTSARVVSPGPFGELVTPRASQPTSGCSLLSSYPELACR